METKTKSGLATAGMVLGIIAIAGAWIPLLNVISILLAALAVVFSVIPLLQKRSKGKAIAGLVLGILSLVIAIGTYGAAADAVSDAVATGQNATTDASAGQTATPTPSPTETVYEIGEIITAKNFEITVESIGVTETVGGQYFSSTASEGGIYVTLDVSYKNIYDKPQGMFSTPTFVLIDPNGVEYSADISASSYYATEKDPDRKAFSDLNPGIKVKDNKVFEVAVDRFGDGVGWTIVAKADKSFVISIQ